MSRLFIIILIVGVVLFSSCDYKKANKVDNKNLESEIAELIFENKYIDFGTVNKDTVLTARFNFHNTSNKLLIIEYVNPDCSCTDYFLSKDTVMPGDEAYIDLILNTETKYGEQKIYAVVKANTEAKLYKLTLKANIID